MIKKIILYSKVLYKGEVSKKLEYKIKDIVKYFHLRRLLAVKHKYIKLNSIDVKFNYFDKKNIEETQNYRIFDEIIKYSDILPKMGCNKEFWRNVKISKYNDIKVIWEYNRLQFLLPIAVNLYKTHDYKYKKLIVDILDSWDNNNQFEYSINWYSNLEIAIRAINISLMLLLINDHDLNNRYMDLLYLHAKHIYYEINFSDKCIPNNHVIGEATALIMLSKIIDCKESKKWYNCAEKILKKYHKIIDEYGVSEENSFSYQFFVTKMYILSLCFVESDETYNIILNLIKRSLSFQKYTIVNEKEIFNYGDNDGGFLYAFVSDYNIVNDIDRYWNLFYNDNCVYDFEISFYKYIYKIFQKRKFIIYNDNINNEYFLSNNIFIYKSKRVSLCFNAKKIKGHAHNDSLAVILSIDGREILCDAGTYSYNLSRKDRNYYRGRNAHSTIIVENNAIPIETFRWLNYEESGLLNFIKTDNMLSIDGYIGDNYKRKITVFPKENTMIIVDSTLNEYVYTSWIFPKNIKLKKDKVQCLNVEVNYKDNPVNIEKKNIKLSKRYLSTENGVQIMKKNLKESKTIIRW